VKNDDEKMDMVDGEMVNEKWMNELYTSPPHYYIIYMYIFNDLCAMNLPLKSLRPPDTTESVNCHVNVM